MVTTTASLRSDRARAYLDRLCAHFAHKVEVERADDKAVCHMPAGTAHLDADDDGLHLRITADDPQALGRTRQVVEDHLIRFAFRQKPAPLDWT